MSKPTAHGTSRECLNLNNTIVQFDQLGFGFPDRFTEPRHLRTVFSKQTDQPRAVRSEKMVLPVWIRTRTTQSARSPLDLLGPPLTNDLKAGIAPRVVSAWIVENIGEEYVADLALELLEASLEALRDADWEPIARTIVNWDATAEAEADGTAGELRRIQSDLALGVEELTEWHPMRSGT